MTIDDLRALVIDRLKAGTDPNEIIGEIEGAVEEAIQAWASENGWSLWGDECWRIDTACSICGSPYPGICGHEKDPNQVVLQGIDAVKRNRG